MKLWPRRMHSQSSTKEPGSGRAFQWFGRTGMTEVFCDVSPPSKAFHSCHESDEICCQEGGVSLSAAIYMLDGLAVEPHIPRIFFNVRMGIHTHITIITEITGMCPSCGPLVSFGVNVRQSVYTAGIVLSPRFTSAVLHHSLKAKPCPKSLIW